MKRVVGVFRGVLRLPIAACSVIARYRQQAGTSDIAAARSLVVGGVGRVRQLHSIHRSYTPPRLLGSRAPLFHRAYSLSSSPSPIHMAATPEPVNVEIRGQQVPVSAGAGIDAKGLQDAISAVPFTQWVQRVNTEEGFAVESVLIQNIDYFGPRVGFIKFKAAVRAANGAFVPGITFMRGGSVAILVLLECDGEQYTILTRQARVPAGYFRFPEIPAGMLDGSGHFAGVAATELQEECDLSIDAEALIDLTELAYGGKWPGMFPSPGGSDEFLRLFLFQTKCEREKLEAMKEKVCGLVDHGEVITLTIIPFADLWKEAPDAKALSALALYNNLKAAGKL